MSDETALKNSEQNDENNYFSIPEILPQSEIVTEKIYVFGHLNPDTDSVCSAIAYANLKKEMGYINAEAFRLGPINIETEFILNHFDTPAPELLRDVNIRVGDLELYTPITLSETDPIKKAWDDINAEKGKGSRLIPVLNEDKTIAGIVSLGDITRIFMETIEESAHTIYETLFENLLHIFESKVLYGNYKYEKIEGNLYIGSTAIKPNAKITDRDIVITAKVDTAKKYAFDYKCGCVIIVTDGMPVDASEFEHSESAIVIVHKNIYNTIVLVKQAISIRSIMKRDGIFKFALDNYVEDIMEFMRKSAHRNFPVVDKEGRFVGIISRRHLLGFEGKKVCLVDHNERSQSVEGLESATIMEIIDHHRVADVKTNSPLLVRAEPVGCTATIIYKMYKENDIPFNRRIAGLLLSAILSDTLMFRSPTCTWEDKQAAEKLAVMAEVELESYGREMFKAGTSLDGVSAAEILSSDLKLFTFGNYASSISQINTLDSTAIQGMKDELLEAMDSYRAKKELDLVILMVTDIVAGGSEILVSADRAKSLVANTFNYDAEQNGTFLKDIVSRKKQMVPRLTVSAQRI